MSTTRVPPFDPDSSRHDLSTYGGRLQHFFGVLDPLLLFLSETELRKSQQLLLDWKEGKPSARVCMLSHLPWRYLYSLMAGLLDLLSPAVVMHVTSLSYFAVREKDGVKGFGKAYGDTSARKSRAVLCPSRSDGCI